MGVTIAKNSLDAIFGADSSGDSPEERARTSKRKFVRSQDHLAFDSEEATGLRLSAWHALQSFGIETLAELPEYGSAVLVADTGEPAATIRTQRLQLGLRRMEIAQKLKISEEIVASSENPMESSDIQILARIGQALALNEMILGYTPGAEGDPKLAIRLREIGRTHSNLGPRAVLAFDEAAWVVATHTRLRKWLGDTPEVLRSEFTPTAEYGNQGDPTWQHGYHLARKARRILGLGDEPINSLRELIETKLAVTIVQMRLNQGIGGATIAIGDDRGIVANTTGHNENVWVRRATLAHELGHLLWDPDESLKRLVVDKYDDLNKLHGKQFGTQGFDTVEARANAFAIEFLAPHRAVRDIFNGKSSSSDGLRAVMEKFGISYAAAKYHVWNAMRRTIDLDDLTVGDITPTADWMGSEEGTLAWFKPAEVPPSRRGLFARDVVRAEREGLIAPETAALYLSCEPSDYAENWKTILECFGSQDEPGPSP